MKDNKENNYIMHSKYNEHFSLLTDEELGRLIRNVNDYVCNGVLPQYSKEDRVLNMAFSFMKATIDIEKEKYLEKCKKNQENGRRGGRPRNNQKPNGLDNNQEKPNGLNENPIDIDNDIDMEIDIDNDIDIDNEIKNKSVCVKNAHAKPFNCHLGSEFKNESCFYCMKKHICPNKESSEFQLSHPDESFEDWDDRKEQYREQLINDLKSRGKNPDIELIDYDWLNSED